MTPKQAADTSQRCPCIPQYSPSTAERRLFWWKKLLGIQLRGTNSSHRKLLQLAGGAHHNFTTQKRQFTVQILTQQKRLVRLEVTTAMRTYVSPLSLLYLSQNTVGEEVIPMIRFLFFKLARKFQSGISSRLSLPKMCFYFLIVS